MPGFGLWSFLTLGISPSAASTFVIIALGLAGGRDEFVLFTIWETEPNDPRWLEALMSVRAEDVANESDGATQVVALLQGFLRVPVSSH